MYNMRAEYIQATGGRNKLDLSCYHVQDRGLFYVVFHRYIFKCLIFQIYL